MSRVSRRAACKALAGLPLAAHAARAAGLHPILLSVDRNEARIGIAGTLFRFRRSDAGWSFEEAMVRTVRVAVPLRREDSFILNGGLGVSAEVVTNTASEKAIRFRFASGASVVYTVQASSLLPKLQILAEGAETPAFAWRTPFEDPAQHGAWVTRGEAATDEEGREVFIDGSGRLVFGHSAAGRVDTAYVLQVDLLDNIDPRGKTMQRSTTFFTSGRQNGPQGAYGFWRLRIGVEQPKSFGIVFERDLGGRLHHVCERFYADALDSLVDLSEHGNNYDPYRALDRMPLRLSCPESLVPHYGWHMEEYFPGYAKASYPYGEDSGIQTGAFLAFEGHATRRNWEKHFGHYVFSQLPLWGERDGAGFFTRRPGGWTRWAYNTDYVTVFPLMEGGNWTDAEHLYRAATLAGDLDLQRNALGLLHHDVDVKLDLDRMTFPPCWNPLTGKLEDHRDDWETTAGLAYCAEMSAQVLYPQTGNRRYLEIADRITDWLAGQITPETRLNWFHPKVNTYHCFMGPLVRALVHRYERSRDARFLDAAKDMAWVMLLTLGTTGHRDAKGRSFTGVTCVGMRGCVDYDCAPNLCHEKDLPFLDIAGALLPYSHGSGFAKFLAMQRMVLPRDSWQEAFHIQEQRDLNLRTNYDNYARGMANLAFSLNWSSDPWAPAYERLAPLRDAAIDTRREIYVVNGTRVAREPQLQVRFLRSGRYRVRIGEGRPTEKHSRDLERGFSVQAPPNSLTPIKVELISADPIATRTPRFDDSTTWLSDLDPFASQRGIGLPEPLFVRDRSFARKPLRLGGRHYEKGLGLAANTVLMYRLDGQFRRLHALLGVDPDAAHGTPKPSTYLTVFSDGHCRFTSGPVLTVTPPVPIDVDVTGVEMLVIRLAGNWDDNGDIRNDFANLVEARLIGKAIS